MPAQETSSGIILPDVVQEHPVEGYVVAAGGGRVTDDGKVIELLVKVGDKVFFNKFAGSSIEIEGKPYLIMTDFEVLGIVDEEIKDDTTETTATSNGVI